MLAGTKVADFKMARRLSSRSRARRSLIPIGPNSYRTMSSSPRQAHRSTYPCKNECACSTWQGHLLRLTPRQSCRETREPTARHLCRHATLTPLQASSPQWTIPFRVEEHMNVRRWVRCSLALATMTAAGCGGDDTSLMMPGNLAGASGKGGASGGAGSRANTGGSLRRA